jgi:hypothetical protein
MPPIHHQRLVEAVEAGFRWDLGWGCFRPPVGFRLFLGIIFPFVDVSRPIVMMVALALRILSTAMHKFVPGFRYLVILSRSAAKAKNPVFALQERDSSAFGLRMTNAILGMNLRIGVLRLILYRFLHAITGVLQRRLAKGV